MEYIGIYILLAVSGIVFFYVGRSFGKAEGEYFKRIEQLEQWKRLDNLELQEDKLKKSIQELSLEVQTKEQEEVKKKPS